MERGSAISAAEASEALALSSEPKSLGGWFARWLAAAPKRWLGRSSAVGQDLTGWQWFIPWLFALGCLIGLNVANSRGAQGLALTLLFAFGLLLGISVGSTVYYYASTDSTAMPGNRCAWPPSLVASSDGESWNAYPPPAIDFLNPWKP